MRLPSTVQQARPFGQQRFSPQQRLVERLQHFDPHSSSFCWQRLQSPVRSFAQRQPLGQHLFRPHQAWPGGQRRWQNCWEAVPTLIVLHSSFGLQHVSPQTRSPRLQQRCSRKFAQNSPRGQHVSAPHLSSPGLQPKHVGETGPGAQPPLPSGLDPRGLQGSQHAHSQHPFEPQRPLEQIRSRGQQAGKHACDSG